MTIKSKNFLLVLALLLVVCLAIVIVFVDGKTSFFTDKFERLSGQQVIVGENEVKVADSATKDKLFLNITSPKDGDVVEGSYLKVTGKTLPSLDVFVNDTETKSDKNGDFTTTIVLDEGENSVLVVVNDASGNYVESEFEIVLESF